MDYWKYDGCSSLIVLINNAKLYLRNYTAGSISYN